MGFLSKLTKPFKSVAKRLKKVGSKVMGSIMKIPGFKQLGQLYAKTFGKLGPLGMIAASFMLPGLGSMIATGWGNLAGSLAANNAAGTFLHAVGTGMQTIASTLSGIGTGITDKINGVMDNAKGMFKEASDWVTGGKNPADFTMSGAKGLTRTQSFTRAGPLPTVGAEPTLLDVTSQRDLGVFDIDNLPRITDTTAPSGSLLGQTPQPGVDTTFSGETGLTRIQSAAAPGSRAASAGTSFAKKALKSGASLLQKTGQEPIDTDLFDTSVEFSEFGTNRLGIGGTASTGGQFLTPQQQAFFQKHASLLGQEG